MVWIIETKSDKEKMTLFTTEDDVNSQLKNPKLDAIEFVDKNGMRMIIPKDKIWKIRGADYEP